MPNYAHQIFKQKLAKEDDLFTYIHDHKRLTQRFNEGWPKEKRDKEREWTPQDQLMEDILWNS